MAAWISKCNATKEASEIEHWNCLAFFWLRDACDCLLPLTKLLSCLCVTSALLLTKADDLVWPIFSLSASLHFVLLPETSHVDTASCLLVYQPTRGGDASGDATGAEVILIQNEVPAGPVLFYLSTCSFGKTK